MLALLCAALVYATVKALAHGAPLRPLAAHWAVVGAFVAVEHALGPLLARLPLYWEARTVFLLYVALPQTGGAAYVYGSLLEPWLLRNEQRIDDAMAAVQSIAVAFCRARIADLVDLVHGATYAPKNRVDN